MLGLYFLIELVCLTVVAAWYVRNDLTPVGEPTKGLLRMSDASDSFATFEDHQPGEHQAEEMPSGRNLG